MQAAQTRLEPFNMNNLPLVVSQVLPLWSPSAGDEAFRRFNVEYIVRNSIAENGYRFQLVAAPGTGSPGSSGEDGPGGSFLAAAFFTRKGDSCTAAGWYERESSRFPAELRAVSTMSQSYLALMDERTLALMDDGDIKLSLFVSRRPGAGSLLLDLLCGRLRAEGWKRLYLWTDCECNWQWYGRHGFSLVREDSYAPFSGGGTDYRTYIFTKGL